MSVGKKTLMQAVVDDNLSVWSLSLKSIKKNLMNEWPFPGDQTFSICDDFIRTSKGNYNRSRRKSNTFYDILNMMQEWLVATVIRRGLNIWLCVWLKHRRQDLHPFDTALSINLLMCTFTILTKPPRTRRTRAQCLQFLTRTAAALLTSMSRQLCNHLYHHHLRHHHHHHHH